MGVHGLSRTTTGVDDITTYMTLTAMECYGIVHRPAMNVSHDIGMGLHCRIRAHRGLTVTWWATPAQCVEVDKGTVAQWRYSYRQP